MTGPVSMQWSLYVCVCVVVKSANDSWAPGLVLACLSQLPLGVSVCLTCHDGRGSACAMRLYSPSSCEPKQAGTFGSALGVLAIPTLEAFSPESQTCSVVSTQGGPLPLSPHPRGLGGASGA